MATPTQFVVILDHKTENIGADGLPIQKEFDFELPADAELSPAIIQFMAHPSKNADELSVNISINDQRVYFYGPSPEDIARMFHVVLKQERATGEYPLRHGTNTLKFRKVNGDGGWGMSDFVIWFRQPATDPSVRRPRPTVSRTRTATVKRRKMSKRKKAR